jgi:hypothetical protein
VNFWSETKGSFESALCGLALLVVCWYFAVVWERGRFSLREACTGGLIAGVALLTLPVILPVVALLLAIGAWLFRAQIRSYALWASTFTGGRAGDHHPSGFTPRCLLFQCWLGRHFLRLRDA